MKVRTTEQLVDEVDAELSWRRKELTDLRYVMQAAVGSGTRQAVMTRAALALLYAHWEGFVKIVGELYLEFVCMQRCRNSELANNMLAIVLRSKLRAAAAANKVAMHLDVVEFFRTQMQDRSALPYKNVIQTESNLSSTVLLEILRTLGLSTLDYESKCHMLDHQLLAKRNRIAHGSYLGIDLDDYLLLHDEITSLMNIFRNQVENAAVSRQYLQSGQFGINEAGEQPATQR